jgi:hypothetical protein
MSFLFLDGTVDLLLKSTVDVVISDAQCDFPRLFSAPEESGKGAAFDIS